MRNRGIFRILLCLGFLIALPSCKNSSNKNIDWLAILRLINTSSSYDRTGGGYVGWYDKDGKECGLLLPGCNYYPDGAKITMTQDPDYSSQSGVWFYYFSNVYQMYVKESPSGIVYNDDTGEALNRMSEESSDGFDVITEMALSDKRRARAAAGYFARKFSLSEEQSTRVALTMDRYSRTQNRTTADVADFTKRLYGVDFKQVLAAVDEYQAGNKAAAGKVVETAAQNLGITPEATKELMMELHGHLLEEQGIDL